MTWREASDLLMIWSLFSLVCNQWGKNGDGKSIFDKVDYEIYI